MTLMLGKTKTAKLNERIVGTNSGPPPDKAANAGDAKYITIAKPHLSHPLVVRHDKKLSTNFIFVQ